MFSQSFCRPRPDKTVAEPALALAGAGLPLPELLVAQILFARRRWLGNRDSFNETFRRERSAIAALVSSSAPARRGERVIFVGLPGLEDSSLNWSVWMALAPVPIHLTDLM